MKQIATLTLLFCLFTAPALAETAKVVPPREDCTTSEAIPASLEAFLAHPNRFLDKCIHVRGFVAFRSVFPSLQWLYEHPKPAERIAIYGKSPPDAELWGMRNYADIVGYAYSCEQFWNYAVAKSNQDNEEAKKSGSSTESIPFIAGNCHYQDGPLLWVSQITVDKDTPNRLFGPAAAKYGSLIPLAPNTPRATETTNAIAPIFEFMRKQDKAGLQAHLETFGDRNAPYNANEAVDINDNPFSFLLGSPKTPDVHYFIRKHIGGENASVTETVGCICKADNCDGKWPIADLDASNASEWPYVCMRTFREGNNMNVFLH